MEKYKIVADEMFNKHNTFLSYMKVECKTCHNTWGVRLYVGKELEEKDFVCSRCLMNEIFSKKEI